MVPLPNTQGRCQFDCVVSDICKFKDTCQRSVHTATSNPCTARRSCLRVHHGRFPSISHGRASLQPEKGSVHRTTITVQTLPCMFQPRFLSVFMSFSCAEIRTPASFRVFHAPYLCVKSSSQTSPIPSDRSRASSSCLSCFFTSFSRHERARRCARRGREGVRRCREMDDETVDSPRAPLHLTRRLTTWEMEGKPWGDP